MSSVACYIIQQISYIIHIFEMERKRMNNLLNTAGNYFYPGYASY